MFKSTKGIMLASMFLSIILSNTYQAKAEELPESYVEGQCYNYVTGGGSLRVVGVILLRQIDETGHIIRTYAPGYVAPLSEKGCRAYAIRFLRDQQDYDENVQNPRKAVLISEGITDDSGNVISIPLFHGTLTVILNDTSNK
jgi:hypothetical protein